MIGVLVLLTAFFPLFVVRSGVPCSVYFTACFLVESRQGKYPSSSCSWGVHAVMGLVSVHMCMCRVISAAATGALVRREASPFFFFFFFLPEKLQMLHFRSDALF